jgi:hypothetical protein
MAKERVFVFNQTRRSFLSLGADVADTVLSRLIGLRGTKRLKADGGLWLVAAGGVDTLGLLFPVDVVYLDEARQVIHLIEHLKALRIGAFKKGCKSILQLPVRTIFHSETAVGDQLTIGQVSQLQQLTAIYLDGGFPRSHEITQVTPERAYIVTEDRWYPGTIVEMRVQYHPQYIDIARLNGHSSASIGMRGMVVDNGKDGVLVDFVYLDKQERHRFQTFLDRI